MDFWLTDDQSDLQEGIRSFLDGRLPVEAIAEREETDAVIDRALWKELGEMGVFSLRNDGLDVRASAIAFEELGRGLVPGPTVATHLAAGFDPDAAAGTKIVGLFEPDHERAIVAHPNQVDALLWLQPDSASMVDPTVLSLTELPRPLDALTPVASSSVISPAATSVEADADALERIGTVLTAAQLVGLAQGALELATLYAREREQFGRPIGSFQAVKHLLAEMLAKTDVARSAVHAAACSLDDAGPDEPARATSVAKLLAGEAALFCGKTGIQVHGGMGFTWEVHAQRYWKRAVVLDATFGTADHHAELVAQTLIDS